MVGLAVLVFFMLREKPANQNSTPLGSSVPGGDLGSAVQVLKGRWLRPDGGYVLEIRNVSADGKIEAGYFNPRPINVAKAEMSQEGPVTRVFIELRDKGYDGSTYTLVYDPGSDQFKGIYYQATLQQRFDVFFVRMK